MPSDLSTVHPERGLPRPTVEALADNVRALHTSDDAVATLARLTAAALEVLPCDAASLTLWDGRTAETQAPTEELAVRIDQIQYDAGEGPCLEAASGTLVVHMPDGASDTRWPTFARRLADQGEAVAALSCQLSVGPPLGRRTIGALNLYASGTDPYREDDELVALLFAAHAAVVIDAAQRTAQLREAIDTRDLIGQAKGILMARGGLGPDDAFEQLRLASQRTNVKLRDLARQVVEARRRSE